MKTKNSIECYIVKPSYIDHCDVLLMHKPATFRHPAFWQPITGGLEASELPLAAALREVSEETSLCLESSCLHDLDFAFEISFPEEELTIKKKLFCAILKDESPVVTLSSEHDDFKWLPISKVFDELYWESNKSTFIPFEAFIKKHLKRKSL